MIYYPLIDADAGGHPRHPDHLDAAGHAALRASCSATAAQWGMNFSYAVQPTPGRPGAGLHHRRATSSAGDAVRAGPRRQHLLRPRPRRSCCSAPRERDRRARRSSPTTCSDPERYGVVEFDDDGRAVSLEEKPAQPKSQLRGHRPLLLRQPGASTSPQSLKPSARGELEITDVNRATCERGAAARRGHGPRLRLARHRHARVAARGVALHRRPSRSARG